MDLTESYGRRLFTVLLSAFFISGFSALLYQVVWQRMLGLFSGSDVRSVTIVTGAYLAGLGVGGLTASLFADRLDNKQAIWIFGLCNLAIATFAFFSRFIFYDLLFRELNALARFPAVVLVMVFISLLWPTTLMGLSLSLLSRALVHSLADAAGRISLLYGINTLGAGVGTIVSGWYLIGTIGYEYTVYVGGFLNVLVGIIALLTARQCNTGDYDKRVSLSIGLDLRHLPSGVWIWCLLVFGSGFIAISLEVIWFRVLAVFLESTAYTFAHLLAFILVGYAIGSTVGASVVTYIHNPRRVFLWIQGLVALYSGLVIWGISLMIGNDFLRPYLTEAGRRVTVLPAIMLLPPNLLLGFYFPVVQKAVQTDKQVVGQRVGLVQVANIAGNTTGSVLTGMVLLHFWGTAGSLRVIFVLGLLFTGVLIWENLSAPERSARIASGLLTSALLAVTVALPKTAELWSRLHGVAANQLFIVAEDSSGVAALLESTDEATLYADGQSQGKIPYLTTHVLLGTLPVLVHPAPKNVMIIGVGSGGTPYSAGMNHRTEHILAIEIIGSELSVLEAYAEEERGLPVKSLFDDARYTMMVSDGRRELALSNRKFDIIEADAILPWRSRSGLLYSREFFEEARSKLADGGIMAQWMPTDRVKATFLSVFPYVVIVGDEILLGSNNPIAYNRQALVERLKVADSIEYLERGGIDASEIRALIKQQTVSSWTPDMPRESDDINTDLFPKDEYYLNNG